MNILNKRANILMHIISIIFIALSIYNIIIASTGFGKISTSLEDIMMHGELIIVIVFSSLTILFTIFYLALYDIFHLNGEIINNLLIAPILFLSLTSLTDIIYVMEFAKSNRAGVIVNAPLILIIVFLCASIISLIISFCLNTMDSKLNKGIFLSISILTYVLSGICNISISGATAGPIVSIAVMVILCICYILYLTSYKDIEIVSDKNIKKLKSKLSSNVLDKIKPIEDTSKIENNTNNDNSK